MTVRDPLTGLITRPGLLRWLTHAHALGAGAPPRASTEPQVVLAVIDLEDFAGVNVEYGQTQGDDLLCTVARRLEDLAGDTGIAARVGGDAFVVGLRTADTSARDLGSQVLDAVRRPVELGDREAIVGGNVAVAAAGPGELVPSVVRRLELALDRARRRGGQTIVVADTLEEDRFNAAQATDLHHALERGEVVVHYLPIVSLVDGQVIGVEALARWCRNEEVLETYQFLDLAVRTGRIAEIGRYVIEEACRNVSGWNTDHPDRPPLRLAVNVARQQLIAPDAVEHLAGLLEDTRLDSRLLCLEISEDSLSELGDAVGPTLAALNALGLRLSVDDFGTGASSLVALQRYQFNELKIDRSFIAQMDVDADSAAIVRGIARLARSLHLELVAEGVERPAQEQMLRSLQCQAAQGWLYARPADDLDTVVALAQAAATASLERQPVPHAELWTGMSTPASAARFVEAVFESAPIGMALIDHTGLHLAANPAVGALLGHSVPDLLGKTCWEFIHPADMQSDLDGMDSLLRGERTSYVVEERAMGVDGTPRWVEVTVSGIPGEHQANGLPTRLLRQVRSIEDDRRAGEDTTVLRSIIAASPDALIITDGQGRCTHWNPAAERLFGWTEGEMLGHRLTRLVSTRDQLSLARVLGDAVRGTTVRWPDATWLSSRGTYCEVHVTIGPIQDADGVAHGLVALARDVSDERAADAALREAHEALAERADDLVQANDRLGTFAATLSHDLLQPVTALEGFLSLLDRDAHELTDEHRSWLHGAIRGRVRIAQAIDALHRNASTDDLPLDPVQLDEVIAELAEELRSNEDALVMDAGDLPEVLADRGLLRQVLANLVQNALRYRADDQPTRVRFDATRDGDTWILGVTDTGRGIHPDELDAVFARGYRGRSSSGTDGTGTGLATVRSLLQHMGGDAWAERHEGGARLCIRLRTVESA